MWTWVTVIIVNFFSFPFTCVINVISFMFIKWHLGYFIKLNKEIIILLVPHRSPSNDGPFPSTIYCILHSTPYSWSTASRSEFIQSSEIHRCYRVSDKVLILYLTLIRMLNTHIHTRPKTTSADLQVLKSSYQWLPYLLDTSDGETLHNPVYIGFRISRVIFNFVKQI